MAAAAAAAVSLTLRARAVEKGAPPELPEGALERWLNFFDAEPATTQFADGGLYLTVIKKENGDPVPQHVQYAPFFAPDYKEGKFILVCRAGPCGTSVSYQVRNPSGIYEWPFSNALNHLKSCSFAILTHGDTLKMLEARKRRRREKEGGGGGRGFGTSWACATVLGPLATRRATQLGVRHSQLATRRGTD